MAKDGLLVGSIAEAARQFRSGGLSPVELLDACLERIGRLNPRLNAFVVIDEPGARQAAQAAERRIRAGEALGPLDGIPIGVKDVFYVKGMRTTAGSKMFEDFVPDYDATAIARLRAAGAVIVGMTNTDEAALGVTTDNPVYGPTHNPWDLGRVPGGSSGGTGAALAASLVLGGTGTDTGGSIRIPAAFCGVVGLKPTYGRVSRHGLFPLAWSMDHPGPLARTVEDAALMLQAMAGPDPLDLTARDVPVPDYTNGLGQPIKGIKVGVPGRYFFEAVEPGVEGRVREAIARLEALGAQLVEVDWPGPGDAEQVVAITSLIMTTEGAAFHEPYLKRRGGEYGEQVYQRLGAARHVLASEYLRAQRLRTLVGRRLASVFEEVDVVATPTLPLVAFPRGTEEVEIGGRSERAIMATVRFTRMADMTGWPAISVPCGLDGRGLPAGLQLMGRPFDEATLVRVAYAYEQARGPAPVPPLAG